MLSDHDLSLVAHLLGLFSHVILTCCPFTLHISSSFLIFMMVCHGKSSMPGSVSGPIIQLAAQAKKKKYIYIYIYIYIYTLFTLLLIIHSLVVLTSKVHPRYDSFNHHCHHPRRAMVIAWRYAGPEFVSLYPCFFYFLVVKYTPQLPRWHWW